MAEFVKKGLIIALCVDESVLLRQDDPVLSQAVAGLVAGFVAAADAAGFEHALDPFVYLPGRRVPVIALREEQAPGLHDVEKSGRDLFGAVLRRRGIKVPGREGEDARPVLGNPAPGGFDPVPGAPAGIKISPLGGPAEKVQSLDPVVGLAGRKAFGPDPVLGGLLLLPGGPAVAELAEDPPDEGLQDRPGFGAWDSAAPEHEDRTSSGSAGPEPGSRGLRIHSRENPCRDPPWRLETDSAAVEARRWWLPGTFSGYDQAGRPRWRGGWMPGWRNRQTRGT